MQCFHKASYIGHLNSGLCRKELNCIESGNPVPLIATNNLTA